MIRPERRDNVALVDSLCDGFEQSWRTGLEPKFEDWVSKADPHSRPELLKELLLVEFELLINSGSIVTASSYALRSGLRVEEIEHLVLDATSRLDERCDVVDRPSDAVGGAEFSTGTLIDDRYQLEEIIGRGGFGVVWRARDLHSNQAVAIKTLDERSANQTDLNVFVREARVVSRLKHTNIVHLQKVIITQGRPLLVFDYIEGCSLANRLNQAYLPFAMTASICSQLADALEYAHSEGVVHRDIKPNNVLIDKYNVCHLVDFGLSKCVDETTLAAEPGLFFGTPTYMSPEQASGRGHHLDGRSDIFSFGTVLYQMLTSSLPFVGDRETVKDAIIKYSPNRPRVIDGTIPRELERICLRCLEKNPDERYQSARELAKDIKKYVRNSHRGTWTSWDWIRRSKVGMGVIVLFLGMLLAYMSVIGFEKVSADRKQYAAVKAGLGIDALRRGDLNNGIRYLSEAVEYEPKPEWLCERAYASIRSNDALAALDDCDVALRIDVQHARAHYVRYLALRKLQRFDEAMKELNVAAMLGDALARTEKRLQSTMVKSVPSGKK